MKLIKNFWPVILLIGIEVILFATNYKQNTYLIGWDNVMPEFNIGLNFKRAFFSVWQDYRGLGLLDGMAHAANLMHTAYIFVLGNFLPQNMLRYVFITLAHLAGGIGMYILLKKLIQTSTHYQSPTINSISFLGALFYLFNIGVIQMFYAPLEVFTFHFAALPVLALWIKNALAEPKIKNLFFLFLVSFLVSSQGFVPTVFGAFLILLFSFLITDFLQNKNIKKIILVLIVIIAANAFWLLPYSYSALKTPEVIQNTRINQFSSEEVYYRNRAQGNIENVLLMKGFMLDSIEYDANKNHYVFFMEQWRSHYKSIPVIVISVILVLISLLGIAYIISGTQRSLFPFLISAAFSFFFLANDTPIFYFINDVLRLWIPVVGEALRFPFTKFIILFAFCLSIFFSIGISVLIKLIQKSKLSVIALELLIVAAILWIASPAFRGNFFSQYLKLNIPNDYKMLFSYLSSKDPEERIALLPAHSFWNWQYRNWGHIGSGFLWYGIEQPILDRAFDPWSLYNEQFYNEFSYAMGKDDAGLFDKVLEKYDVSYLLLDKTILNSVSSKHINYPALENFLESNEILSKEAAFGNLMVYKVRTQKPDFSLLDLKNVRKVSPGFHFAHHDIIYESIGDYIGDENNPDIIFLLPSFYSGKLQKDLLFEAENSRDSIILRPKSLPSFRSAENLTLEISSLFEKEFIIPVEIKINGRNITVSPLYPRIRINESLVIAPQEQNITLAAKRIQNPTSIELVDTGDTVQVVNGGAKTFILNNFINVLKLKAGQQEELIILDTQDIARPVIYIPLPKTQIEKVEILVEKFESVLNVEDIIQRRLFRIDHKPDSLKLFPNDISTGIEEKQDGIILQARGNSSVDINFYRDNLPHQGSYLMFVDSDYYRGLPVNFYVDSQMSMPQAETRLAKENRENTIFIPQTESAFKGYGFHFSVKSLGREHAQSKLKNISMYPIPGETINSIKILSGRNASTGPSVDQAIVSSQSYDSGWRAYSIQSSNSTIQNFLNTTLPFLSGSELKNHVEVNGWANGWLLEANSQKPTAKSQIVIVYLPQYLEYAGFGLLILTFLFFPARLLYFRFISRKNKYTPAAGRESQN